MKQGKKVAWRGDEGFKTRAEDPSGIARLGCMIDWAEIVDIDPACLGRG